MENEEKITLHKALICARCGTVIEPDEPYRDVDGIPYHEECFKEMFMDWKGVKHD